MWESGYFPPRHIIMRKPTKTKAGEPATNKPRKPSLAKEAAAKYETPPRTAEKTSNSDSKGRVVLGPKHANKLFRVTEEPDGNILLEPVVTIHEREIWLYRNPTAMAMVQKGIEESKAGKGKYLGSFAKYADIDIDEDED